MTTPIVAKQPIKGATPVVRAERSPMPKSNVPKSNVIELPKPKPEGIVAYTVSKGADVWPGRR